MLSRRRKSDRNSFNSDASSKQDIPAFHDVDLLVEEVTSFTSSIDYHVIERFRSVCSSESETSGDEIPNDFTLVWNPRSFYEKRASISSSCNCKGNGFNPTVDQETAENNNSFRHLRAISEGSHAPSFGFQSSCLYEEKMKNRRRSETVINSNQESKPSRCKSLQHAPQSFEPHRTNSRRSAVVPTLPSSDLSDLSDTIANLQRNQPLALSSHLKKSKWNLPRLNFMNKDKTQEQKLELFLSTWQPNTYDQTLESAIEKLRGCNIEKQTSFRSDSSLSSPNLLNSRSEKRNKAVWELFTSERTYLIDHLLVIRQVFMEPLKKLQCEGYLLSVDVRTVFGNLEELCELTLDFCKILLKVIGVDGANQFGSSAAIVEAFEEFQCTVCPPYRRYFSGYHNSLNDREDLKSNEEFLVFLKWCEKNPRCQRLSLNDFLAAPIQHLTKYPLLLGKIAQYTDDKHQTKSIEETIAVVDEALKTIEYNVSSTNHHQFLRDLESSISWPSVFELDTKTVLPESLRTLLSQQPCKNIMTSTKKQLVYEGFLNVVENGKQYEVYCFLFDDMLLLTKLKKTKRKPSEIPSSLKKHELMKDGTLLSVYRQPIALDRFMMYDINGDQSSAMGLKKAFVLVQENRFRQMCGIIMLQAGSEEVKRNWLTHIASTAALWMEKNIINKREKALLSNGSFNHSRCDVRKTEVASCNQACQSCKDSATMSDILTKEDLSSYENSDAEQLSPLSTPNSRDSETDFL